MSNTSATTATTTQFWDSVATIYENSPMTSEDSDAELSHVITQVRQIKPNLMICLGCADGCRDPSKILKDSPPIENLVCNDLSAELLKVCQNRLTKDGHTNAKYFAGSMHLFPADILGNRWRWQNGDYPLWMIGVYNAGFIEKALEIYREEKAVIGSQFEMRAISFNGQDVVQTDTSVSFEIDRYESYLDSIKALQNVGNFVAYSIKTNKGFISHFYAYAGLEKFVRCVFAGKNVNVITLGKRYIMVEVGRNPNHPNTGVITTLNNVVGNIPFAMQKECLNHINKIFF